MPQAPDTSPLQHLRARLEEADIKVTAQRLAVYQQVYMAESHPSAEEVHLELRDTHPTLSLGTVYRTLDLLADAALLRTLPGPDGRKRYDSNTQNHHHLVCTQTLEVVDYEDDQLTELIQDYLRRRGIPGFRIEDFQLHIHGSFAGPSAEKA